MKYLTTIGFLLFVYSSAFSQEVAIPIVKIDSLVNYTGKTVTVCEKVLGTFLSKRAKKTTYLNFGKPYPNSTFTVVIFEGDLPNFKSAPSEYLKDKNVCITGTVVLYKGKPEMIIKNESQIKIQ